jgi:Family of unknown function (DUF6011)
VILRRTGTRARFPNSVTITDAKRTYFGSIGTNGVLYPSREMTPDIRRLLVRLATDPVGAALDYARLSGCCAFCNYRLSDARSLAHGYGPDCARRFGLPWKAPRHSHGFFSWDYFYGAPDAEVR